MDNIRRRRALTGAIVILLMASTSSAAPRRYTFTGTVNQVFAISVETSIAIGDDAGFTLVLDFNRDATIDSRLGASFGFSTLPTFLGGFHADLLTGSIEGPAASGCFGLQTFDPPIIAEINGGISPITGTEAASILAGFANDSVTITGPLAVAARNWKVGDAFTSLENLCNFAGSGIVAIGADLVLERIEVLPNSTSPGGVGAFAGRITILDDDSGESLPVTCATVVAKIDETVKGTGAADLNGDYFIRDLRLDDYTLEVFAPGFAPVSIAVTMPDVVQRVQNFELVAATVAVDINGTITELDGGSPLGGARIDVTNLLGAPLATTFTCATGTYEVTGLPTIIKQTTQVIVTVSAQGFEGTQETVTIGEIYNASLNKGIIPNSIAGAVTSAALTGLIEGARIQVQPIRGITSITRVTGPDGLFTVTNLENGDYGIRVSAQGFQAQTLNRTVSGGLVSANVTLAESDTLAPGEIPLPPPAGCFAGGAIPGSSGGNLFGGDLVFFALAAAVLYRARRRAVVSPI